VSDDTEFITRLSHFGLGKKEAQPYLHLLKYGPRTPSPIAKALNTHRTDVHRTLISSLKRAWCVPHSIQEQFTQRSILIQPLILQ